MQLRQESQVSTAMAPSVVAFVPQNIAGVNGQRYVMMVWPKPDTQYRVQYRYHARQLPLSEQNPVPLGGPEHAETILAAVLAAAEQYLDDSKGPKYETYMERLAASVSIDRRFQTSNLGYMHNHEASGESRRIQNIVTYEKYPI